MESCRLSYDFKHEFGGKLGQLQISDKNKRVEIPRI
jgi:hypothetical protein